MREKVEIFVEKYHSDNTRSDLNWWYTQKQIFIVPYSVPCLDGAVNVDTRGWVIHHHFPISPNPYISLPCVLSKTGEFVDDDKNAEPLIFEKFGDAQVFLRYSTKFEIKSKKAYEITLR